MATATKKCMICGVTHSNKFYAYYEMEEIRSCYVVLGLVDCCADCIKTANSFVHYWGKKKKKDLDDLRDYLLSGVAAKKIYSAMMNGGCY